MSIVKPQPGSLILPAHPLAQDIVASWPMYATGGVLRDAGCRGFHGTINGASWVPGQFGRCLSFNGSSDHVNFGSPALGLTPPFSIAVWLWLASDIADNDVIITYGQYVNPFRLRMYSTGGLEGTIKTVGGSDGPLMTTGLSTEVWQYVVMTYDGTDCKLYVNGVLKVTRVHNHGGALVSESGNLVLGYDDSSSCYWSGRMDATSLYSRCLTAGEIQSLFVNSFQMFQERPILVPLEIGAGATSQTVTPSALSLTLTQQSLFVLYDHKTEPAALAGSLTLLSPTVSTSANVTVTPSALTLTAAAQGPSVTLSSSVSPDALTATLAQQTPTPTVSCTVAPNALELTSAALAPTAESSCMVEANALALTATAPAPIATSSCAATPQSLAITAVVQAATATLSCTVAPSALALTATIGAPVETLSSSVAPSAQSLTVTGPAPTIASDGNITVSPSALAVTATCQSPSIAYDHVVSMGSALAVTATVNAPTAETAVNVTVSPSALAVTATLNTPTTTYGCAVSVTTQTLTATLKTPAVTYDYQYGVSGAQSLTAAMGDPTISTSAAFGALTFFLLKKRR